MNLVGAITKRNSFDTTSQQCTITSKSSSKAVYQVQYGPYYAVKQNLLQSLNLLIWPLIPANITTWQICLKVNMIFTVEWTTWAVEKEPEKIQACPGMKPWPMPNRLGFSFYCEVCEDHAHFQIFIRTAVQNDSFYINSNLSLLLTFPMTSKVAFWNSSAMSTTVFPSAMSINLVTKQLATELNWGTRPFK